jgi:hypothetical protein
VGSVLPVVASLLHATGYSLYIVQMVRGKTIPNPVTLFIWLVLTILNAATFSTMNGWVAALQTFVGVAGMISTFFYALFNRKLRWPEKDEWKILLLCLVAIWVWKISDAKYANLVLLVGVGISFWPYVKGLWKNPGLDESTAWWYFTSAWTATLMNTFVFKGLLTLSIVMPATMVVAHLTVALLCSEERKTAMAASRT